MDWFYAREGQRQGPVSEARLRELRAAGAVGPDDLVWRAGFPDWRPARDVPELGPTGAAAGMAGGPLPTRWLGAYVVIVGVLGAFSVAAALAELLTPRGWARQAGAGAVLYNLASGGLSIAVAVGLARRRAWAWLVNYWLFLVLPLVLLGLGVLVGLVLMVLFASVWRQATGMTPGAGLVGGALVTGALALWPILNIVYFRRRRHLFR
jgi:hypothetical protein